MSEQQRVHMYYKGSLNEELNISSVYQKIPMRPWLAFFCLFDLILYVYQQSFSYVGTGLPGLNQY